MTTASNLLTYAEAEKVLAVSRSTLYRMVTDGYLTPVRLPIGGPRIRRTDIDKLLEAPHRLTGEHQ